MDDPAPPPPADESPTQHLARAAHADRRRLAPLVERLTPPLYGWAVLRIPRDLRGRFEPEELLQDVWVRALGAFKNFDPDRGSFRAWLFQVAKYTLLDAMRRQAVRAPMAPGHASGLSRLVDEATAVSRQVARRQDVASFLHWAEQLGAEDQALLVHHGLEGLTLGESAARLGLGKAAAQKRWQRLRARLVEQGWREAMVD